MDAPVECPLHMTSEIEILTNQNTLMSVHNDRKKDVKVIEYCSLKIYITILRIFPSRKNHKLTETMVLQKNQVGCP